MTPAEFVKAPRRTIVGASLSVTAPTGQYWDTKLINIGANRWTFKPEIGVSVPYKRWDLDAYLGTSFFTANPSFYPGGQRKAQDPVYALQLHASYTIRPRLWVALDSTWYAGGRTRVNDGPPSQDMNNSRLGATLSLPVGRTQSLKIGFSSGVSVRTGTDFNTIGIAWQKLWLSPPKRQAPRP
jgi:hypothetical protein